MLKGFVHLVVGTFALGVLAVPALALTRVPTPGTGEASLLYWRYLCRGQPQAEREATERRELSCPSQRWKVRTLLGQDRVVEVVEDAS